MAKSRSAKKGRRSSTKSSSASRSAGSRSARGRSASARKAASRSARGANGSGRNDAIALLKADHREVERLFAACENARSEEQKGEIAAQLCTALRTHAAIEEEIFYPAYLEATGDTEIHHEAEIEHEGVKRLVEEIEATGPGDDHFDARVSVLKEMVRHHVKEEEKRSGMFGKAQQSSMDLRALGQELKERKLELMGETAETAGEPGERPPLPQARPRRELRARSS
jgi:hemerythrin superfamily protein